MLSTNKITIGHVGDIQLPNKICSIHIRPDLDRLATNSTQRWKSEQPKTCKMKIKAAKKTEFGMWACPRAKIKEPTEPQPEHFVANKIQYTRMVGHQNQGETRIPGGRHSWGQLLGRQQRRRMGRLPKQGAQQWTFGNGCLYGNLCPGSILWRLWWQNL